MELKINISDSKIGLYIDSDMLKKLEAIIAECDTEVGWLCLTTRMSRWEFKILDIFIPEQQANGGTTDIDSSAISALENVLWAENRLNMQSQVTDGLYMWGHSHVNMSTSPSPQDDTQFKTLCSNNPPYFIRMIANKKREYNNTIFINDDVFGEITLSSMPFKVIDSALDKLREEVRKELKEKVRPVVATPSVGIWQKGLYGLDNWGTGGKNKGKDSSPKTTNEYWDRKYPRSRGGYFMGDESAGLLFDDQDVDIDRFYRQKEARANSTKRGSSIKSPTLGKAARKRGESRK